MASICNDDWASLGVMGGHERKTLRLSATNPAFSVKFMTGSGGGGRLLWSTAYNLSTMLPNLNALLAPALMDRLVLVVNHVLSAEPAAVERLKPHRGRVLRLDLLQVPRLLPTPPPLAFMITPAGLVEWCRSAVDADLWVRLEAANPAALAFRR